MDAHSTVELHPFGYRWQNRFPSAERLAGFEGGAFYTAEQHGAWWLITDEGTVVDLLDPETEADVIAELIRIERFDEKSAWEAAIAEVWSDLRGEHDDGFDDLLWERRVAELMAERLPRDLAEWEALLEQRPGGDLVLVDDSAREFDDLMARLSRLTGFALGDLASEKSLAWVNERDHLAPCFRDVLRDELPEEGLRPAGAGERRYSFPDHFPRVGDVDALLAADGELPVWVELKCGSDRYALWACAWDAVKCALGVRREAARFAYLLAGAPDSLWEEPVLGAELFEGGTWTAAELRMTFEAAFRDYEKGAAQPVRVPDFIYTFGVGEPVRFTVAGIPWSLHCARVEAPGKGWFDWPRFLDLGGEALGGPSAPS